jgi:hypothetical protein
MLYLPCFHTTQSNKTYNFFGGKSVEQAIKETEDKFGAYWCVHRINQKEVLSTCLFVGVFGSF